MLSTDHLSTLVDEGAVDTVLVVFPDLQGRFMGKRVLADFFLSELTHNGGAVEVCNYLLAVNVDMTVLDGFRFASWDEGYGDVQCRPDMSTLRLVPWLEKTALVICDVHNADGGTRSRCRPDASSAVRSSVPRANGVHRHVRHGTRVLPLRGLVRGGMEEEVQRPHTVEQLHPRLPRPADHEGRVVHTRCAQRHGRRRYPRGVLQG